MKPSHLERADIAAQAITEASAQIEAERELPAQVLHAMHQQRLFRLTLPEWLGGDELDPARLSQVTMRIATADASAAWCLGQASGCAMSAAYLDEEVAREVFGPEDSVLAWGAGPQGKAVAVDGGFQVSGSWRFASGGKHATWLGGHCKVFEADGSERRDQAGKHVERTVLIRRDVAKIADDWYVIGLRGTRSEGYTIDDVFVDNAYTFHRDDAKERRSDAPLYVFPTTYVYASAFSGVALGVARGALDDLRNLAAHKTAAFARTSMRESPVFQTELAELEAKWGSARAFQQTTLLEVWDDVSERRVLNMEHRARIRLAATYAINQCTEVVHTAYRLAGSHAIFESGPFERRFRDMHSVSQQIQASRTHYEAVGRFLLGHEDDML
ncbi:MAG: acyl-CoA dehydrogenase family protein [Betaproteobacteria bacterium]|nr:MAG: acyl-CoA dehydrogenase family protein [Betaproteobacteria bacterium]